MEKVPEKAAATEKRPINETLLVWRAPSRVFKKRDKEFFSTISAVAILFSIVFLFMKEFLLIVVAWAAVFFVYALSKTPPEEVEHKITAEGITSMNHSYLWEEMDKFWFEGEGAERMLKITSGKAGLFGELAMLLGNTSEEKIKTVLSDYLPFVEAPHKTFADTASDWLVQKFSSEKSSKQA